MFMLNQPKMLSRFAAAVLLLATSGAWAQAPSENLVTAYTKPGVNLRQYQQFLLEPLNLSDTRLVPPPWVENPDPHEWSLTRRNRDFLASSFASSVREGIAADGRFKVVSEPTPGTLQVEVHLISLTPWASRNEQGAQTLGSGTLTFEAHIRDARTAELLAIYQGTQQVGQEYQENTEFNKAAGLTEHFTTWGRNISRRLADAQAR